MSEESLEVVQGIYNAWSHGDYAGALVWIHENVEFVGPPDVSGGLTWRSHDEVSKAIAEWIGTWDDFEYELRGLTDSGDEVLAEGWQRGRGKGSGVEVSEAIYSVWTVRDGKAVRQRMFRDRQQALDAAGLSE